MGPRSMVIAATLILGCTAPRSEPDRAGTKPETKEDAEARAWLEAYRRGETSMSTDDPAAVYAATPDDPCQPMPPERPEGFELIYWQDPYEDQVEVYYGVAAQVCQFEWDMIGLDPPAVACARPDSATLDALWAELRELRIWALRMRPLEPTPHSAGFGLVVRWPGSRCEILDVLGIAEIVEADEAAFRAALDAFRTTYDQTRAASG